MLNKICPPFIKKSKLIGNKFKNKIYNNNQNSKTNNGPNLPNGENIIIILFVSLYIYNS